jgi:hypothetical protein
MHAATEAEPLKQSGYEQHLTQPLRDREYTT